MPCSELWNACAVPEKVPVSVAGAASSRVPACTWPMACESATPGRRSNEKVTEGSWPRCVTCIGPTP